MASGLIYKVTSPSDKIYVGQTIKTLEERKQKHFECSKYVNPAFNNKFYCAIRKYGFENFKWEIVYNNVPVRFLNEYEIWTIDFYNSYKYGYNMTLGGTSIRGFRHSDETKEKWSKLRKGYKPNEKQLKALLDYAKSPKNREPRENTSTMKGNTHGFQKGHQLWKLAMLKLKRDKNGRFCSK